MKFLKSRLFCTILIILCIVNSNFSYGGYSIGATALRKLAQEAGKQLPKVVKYGSGLVAAAISCVKKPEIPNILKAVPPHIRNEAAAKVAQATEAMKQVSWKNVVIAGQNIPKSELIKAHAQAQIAMQSSAQHMVQIVQKYGKQVLQQATQSIPAITPTQAACIMAHAVQTIQPTRIAATVHITASATPSTSNISFHPTIANNLSTTPATPSISVPTQASAQPISSTHVTVTARDTNSIQSDIQATNHNYQMQQALEDHRIFSNPATKAIYLEQAEKVHHNLNQATNISATPDIIKAQLTLLNNAYIHAKNNEALTYAKNRMLEQLCTSDGEFIGCFDGDTLKNIKHYAQQKVSLTELPGNFCRDIKKLFGYQTNIQDKFLSNPYNINLYNFCQNINNKNLFEAERFLKLITPDHACNNCNKCRIYGHMLEAFKQLRTTFFNEHDIARIFEADTIWPHLKKLLDPKGADYTQQVANVQHQLTNRFELLQTLLEKVGKSDVAEPVKKIFYELVSVYAKPHEAAKYLSGLTIDSPDQTIREAAALIFNTQNIPKIYDYASTSLLKDIVMPQALALGKNKELRELYFNFLSFGIKNDLQKRLLQQGARHIQQSCSSTVFASMHKYFADLAYHALTNINADKRILNWADFSQTFTNPVAAQIQQRMLPILNGAIGDFYLPVTSTNPTIMLQQSKADSIMTCVSKIYDALANDNTHLALDIEKNQLAHLTKNLIIEELQKITQPSFLQIHRDHIIQSLCHTIATTQPITDNQNISTNAPCTIESDKSKNLEKSPKACLPEDVALKPGPQCKLPESKDASLPACPETKIKTEVDRRHEQFIEELKKQAQEGKPQNNDCNWSKRKQLPSFKDEAPQTSDQVNSPELNSKPNETKEVKVQENTEEKLQKLKKQLLDSKKDTLTPEQIKLIDQFIERVRNLSEKYGIENVIGALEIYNATKGTQSADANIDEKLAEATKESSSDAIEKSIQYATSKIKLEHFFNKEIHGFQSLLEKMENNKEKIVCEVIKALVSSNKLPAAGKFDDIPVNIAGYTIYVRGIVHDGIIKIGTMFIP